MIFVVMQHYRCRAGIEVNSWNNSERQETHSSYMVSGNQHGGGCEYLGMANCVLNAKNTIFTSIIPAQIIITLFIIIICIVSA